MTSFKSTPMKAKGLFLSLALLFTASIAFAQKPPQVVTPLQNSDKILFIGNSFTEQGGGLPSTLQAIIKSDGTGFNITLAQKIKGMGTLKEYVTMEELGMMDEIKKGGWKYVVIQGWEDAISIYGYPACQDTMLKYLKILDNEVVKVGAQTILYEPHVGANTYKDSKTKSNATYAKLKNEVSVFHAPVINAWDTVHNNYPPTNYACPPNGDGFIKFMYADCGHQSNTGMTLDALTFYTILTQRSGETLNPNLPLRTSNPALYEELAAIGYNTGKDILRMNNSWIEDTQNPTTPTNLSASNKAPDSFVLTWTASTDDKGVLGYNIYRDNVYVGQTTTPRFRVAGLVPDTEYSVKVMAFDSEKKESAFSDALKVITEPFVLVDEKGDLLTWDFTGDNGKKSVEATTIMAGVSSTSPSSVIGSGPTFSVGDSGMFPNSFTGGNHENSTLGQALSRNAYMTFSIAPQDGNSISIEKISFDGNMQNNKIIKYTLMSSITGFNSSGELGTITGISGGWAKGSIPITGHDDIEESIEFRIYIYGEGNQFETFAIDNLVVTGGVKTMPLPFAPTELTASNLTEAGFTLKWKAAADAVSYKVFKDGELEGATNKLTLDIEGNIGDVFSMTVLAVKAGGEESEQSEPLSVTIPDLQAPTVPQNLSATGVDYYTFTLLWEPSFDNVGVVNYNALKDGEYAGETADVRLPVPWLTPNTTYKMRVRAVDAFGNESAFSEEYPVTTLALPVPEGLAASEVTKSTFTLSWTCATEGVAEGIQYNIYKDGTLYDTTEELSVEVAELSPNTTYNMTVKLIDGDGNESALSDALQVITEDDIAVDNAARSGIIIYPNPSKGIISIACDGSETNTIYVYDNAGKLLRLIENAACQSDVDLSTCPAGNYLIKVESGTAVYTEKLVIEK